MKITGRKNEVRGVYKIRDLNVFDGFTIYYSGGFYSTALNSRTLKFFEHIKRK